MAERKDMVVNKEEFPSNSYSSREKAEERKLDKVVESGVKRKKKPLGKKMAESFFDEDSKSVGGYILWDVLIPAAKSMISDAVTLGVETILYGGDKEDSRNRTRRDRGRSYISYNDYYDNDRRGRRTQNNRRGRSRHDFDDVLFDTRRDAEAVLTRMIDVLDEYDVVTVGDFYDLVDMDSVYTDRDWGWDNLGGAYVDRVRDGYIIRLPRVIPLR